MPSILKAKGSSGHNLLISYNKITMSTFTIITVCLNIASTIQRTCESIVNQTFQDFQWIVVDGASTDGTLAILKKYSYRIDILVSEPDKGIYNAMNKGIKQATGEYINFMNGGDEFYDKDVLKRIVETKPNTDVIYGDCIMINHNNSFLFRNQRKLCPKSLYQKSINHQATFTRNAVMRQYLFDEHFKIAADYDFFIKIYFKKTYSFKRTDTVISLFYADGISSTNPEVNIREKTFIRKKYFCIIQRLKFDQQLKQNIKDKIRFIIMVATHPRYIAGWLKRKLIKQK